MAEIFEDPNNFEELLQYFRRFKVYDVLRSYQFEATSLLIWGLLLLFAGLLDYTISLLLGINSPNGLPWLVVTIMGVVIDWFLGKSISLSPSYRSRNSSFSVAFWMLGLWASITILIVLSLFYLIMPAVGLIIGFLFVTSARKNQYHEKAYYFLPTPLKYLPSFASFLSTLVNVGLVFLGGKELALYHGLVFGLLVGVSMGFVALRIQRRIENVDLDLLVDG